MSDTGEPFLETRAFTFGIVGMEVIRVEYARIPGTIGRQWRCHVRHAGVEVQQPDVCSEQISPMAARRLANVYLKEHPVLVTEPSDPL